VAVRRLAAFAIAVCTILLAPVMAGAATSYVPSPSIPSTSSAIAPVGQVRAPLLAPGHRHPSSGYESPPFRAKDPAALRAAKLKAVLDGLVDKGVITRAQADAILDAIAQHAGGDHDRTHLREFVGDVFKESVNYIGLPAEAVKAQVQAGKSLGQIAGQQPGKSRDGLVADLHAKAEARIKAAVDAGKLTTEQATALRTKVDEAIVKIVDHEGAPRRDKTTPNAPAKPAAPTAKPTQ